MAELTFDANIFIRYERQPFPRSFYMRKQVFLDGRAIKVLAICCVLTSFLVKICCRKLRLFLQGAKVQMTYIVAEPCVNCRYTDCALVCPVEAFHLDDDMLVINPETCIDCDACVPECPVEAVFSEAALPAEWSNYTAINADRALSGLPTITARLDPLCE